MKRTYFIKCKYIIIIVNSVLYKKINIDLYYQQLYHDFWKFVFYFISRLPIFKSVSQILYKNNLYNKEFKSNKIYRYNNRCI